MSTWIVTSEQLPPEGQPVLGWWSAFEIRAIVRWGNRWNVPGYRYGENYLRPVYWMQLPELPIENAA